MATHELAQVNIARFLGPLDSPVMREFADNLDRINALADASPGFCWRLQTEEGNAMDLRLFEDDLFVNLSTWTDLESLKHFVYRTVHVELLKRRHEWAHRMELAHLALWCVPAGHQPSLEETRDRLELLRAEGATPEAFTFHTHFPAPTGQA